MQLSRKKAPKLINGYKFLLGMNVVNKIGSVTFRKGKVVFGDIARVKAQELPCVEVHDQDFSAKFDCLGNRACISSRGI